MSEFKQLLSALTFGFWVGAFTLIVLPQLYYWWSKRINKRVDEMLKITSEIKTLAERKENYRHLPVERIDFSRKEAYVYSVSGLILVILCTLGFFQGYELIASGWWSFIGRKLTSPEVLNNSYAIRPKGIAFIVGLKILPFLLWYVSFKIAKGIVADTHYSCLWKRCLTYLRIDCKRCLLKI